MRISLANLQKTQIRLYKSCFQETEQGFVQVMELPPIDDIFKEMRFVATKPVTSSVDSGRKNNSDMGSNSVMVRTELNKDRPESIVLKEKSLAGQKPTKFNKTACLTFRKLKDPYL